MMQLVTFSEPFVCGFKKSSGGLTLTFEANRPYLLAHSQMLNIMRDTKVQARTYKVSLAQSRIPNFNIAALKKGQRVLLFNASGGYGDQILTWPVAKILSHLGASVHVLTDPGNNLCWWNLPFVKSVQTVPVLWETVQMYDHFAHFDAVVNMDEHQDQIHPVDAMLHRMGIDHEDPHLADLKCVRPVFTPSELGTLQQYTNRRIGLYQMSSANPVRGLPAKDSVYIATALAESTPDIHWLCLYDEFVPKEYVETLNKEIASRKISNIEPFTAVNLRELWALTEHVSVVVAPDSMMAHISGVFGTPCVGLWGPVDPSNRVRYYANHYPIWQQKACPHAPCFTYSSVFPKYCPPAPVKRSVCEVMSSISAEAVIDLVKKVAR